MGGLSRRATVLKQAEQEGPLLTIDGGDLFWKGGRLQPENLWAQRIKAELLAEDMMALGLDAWVPGEADWKIGVETVLGLVERYNLPAVAGNLVCGEQSFPGYVRIERAGRSIGVVGVVDTVVDGCTTSDPVVAAQRAVEELGQVDVLLGVFHGSADLDGRILREVEGFDFFFNGHTAQRSVSPREVNGAWFLGAGSRGKLLGHLQLTWRENGQGDWMASSQTEALERRLRRFEERAESSQKELDALSEGQDRSTLERRVAHYQTQVQTLAQELGERMATEGSNRSFTHTLIELDRTIGDSPETQARVVSALRSIEDAAGSEGSAVEPLTGGPFLGSEACLACHPGPAAQWKTTSHSHAMQTLVDLNRSMDPDCYSCHATGAHHPEGPTLPGQVGERLANVGCESCHGPGAEHARNPIGTMDASTSAESCVTCHDGVQDGGRFDLESYLPKVVHSATN